MRLFCTAWLKLADRPPGVPKKLYATPSTLAKPAHPTIYTQVSAQPPLRGHQLLTEPVQKRGQSAFSAVPLP